MAPREGTAAVVAQPGAISVDAPLDQRDANLSEEPTSHNVRPDAAQTLLFIDTAFEGAPDTLKEFDRNVFVTVARNQFFLTNNDPVRACAAIYARRISSSFHVEAQLEVVIKVADETLFFESVSFREGLRQRAGDETFRDCFSAGVRGLRLPCTGCRSGRVTYNWGAQGSYPLPPP